MSRTRPTTPDEVLRQAAEAIKEQLARQKEIPIAVAWQIGKSIDDAVKAADSPPNAVRTLAAHMEAVPSNIYQYYRFFKHFGEEDLEQIGDAFSNKVNKPMLFSHVRPLMKGPDLGRSGNAGRVLERIQQSPPEILAGKGMKTVENRRSDGPKGEGPGSGRPQKVSDDLVVLLRSLRAPVKTLHNTCRTFEAPTLKERIEGLRKEQVNQVLVELIQQRISDLATLQEKLTEVKEGLSTALGQVQERLGFGMPARASGGRTGARGPSRNAGRQEVAASPPPTGPKKARR
jgi:hypothetical protein